MNVEKLKEFTIQGLSQREIAKELNCSQGKIKYWMAKLNLKRIVSKEIKCRLCDETDSSKFYVHKDGRIRYRCKKCDNVENIKRFRNYKKEAVEYKGGKCTICEYSKCLGALDFHHLDPKQKDPKWKQMRNWPFEKIKEELNKCILVCCRCHKEIHWMGD